jgi:DNA polymerase-3 subunit delta'
MHLAGIPASPVAVTDGRGNTVLIEAGDDHAAERLGHAAEHVRDQAGAAGLTDPDRLHKLATWFDAANRARELLRSTVRADLVMADLLLAWREASRPQPGKGDNR